MKTINKNQIAEKVGVSRQAINNLTRSGGSLFDALTPDGLIDLEHPSTLRYLKKKKLPDETLASLGLSADLKPSNRPATNKTKPKAKSKAKPKTNKAAPKTAKISGENNQADEEDQLREITASREMDENINSYLDMTLREITERFGTDIQFKNLLDARHRIEDIKTKEFKNKIQAGEYIPRDMVERYVFPFIDNAFRRLVEDLPGTLTRQVKAKVLAETEDEDVTDFIRDSISKTLKGLKDNAIRVIN